MAGYGDLWKVALFFIFVVLPLVSLIHCGAMITATWFAVGQARLSFRLLSLVLFLVLSTVSFLGFQKFDDSLMLTGHVVVLANVVILTTWLLARYESGVRLVRIRDGRPPPNKSPSIRPGQFPLAFLFWPPIAVCHVLGLWQFYPARTSGNVGVTIGESLLLAAVLVAITYVALKRNKPGRMILFLPIFVVPGVVFATAWSTIQAPLFDLLAPLLLSLFSGSPLLCGLLLLARAMGFRLIRVSQTQSVSPASVQLVSKQKNAAL